MVYYLFILKPKSKKLRDTIDNLNAEEQVWNLDGGRRYLIARILGLKWVMLPEVWMIEHFMW